MVLKRIKVRLYPTVKQKEMLDNHFGAYRYCYNLCLEYKSLLWRDYKIKISAFDMQKELFIIMKNTPWLKKCKVECLREAAHNVDKTYKKFFIGKGFPKFKSKKNYQSVTAFQSIKVKGSKIIFFKNAINYKDSTRYIDLLERSKIRQVTFKKYKSGDYFAICLIYADNDNKIIKSEKTIGIDLGISDLIITSSGVKYQNGNYLRSTSKKMTTLQRKFFKTKKGGSNREKLRVKIAKIHKKVFRMREHYYHQVTNELIRDNQTIVVEGLRIKNLMKNNNISRSISDASWGMLILMLEYKALWAGKRVVKLSSFYPSTKTCSKCGNIKDMPLSERVYNCDKCGFSIDRDINAAINIRNAGLKIPGVSVEGVGYEPYEAESKRLIINN